MKFDDLERRKVSEVLQLLERALTGLDVLCSWADDEEDWDAQDEKMSLYGETQNLVEDALLRLAEEVLVWLVKDAKHLR